MRVETKIQKDIMEYLTKNNILHLRLNPTSSKFGLADIGCIIGGTFVSLEVKDPNGGVKSELQLHNQKRYREKGAWYDFVTSVEEVKVVLKQAEDFGNYYAYREWLAMEKQLCFCCKEHVHCSFRFGNKLLCGECTIKVCNDKELKLKLRTELERENNENN